MRTILLIASALVLGILAVCGLAAPGAKAQPGPAAPLEVPGRTRCMISHRGIISSPILRPVVDVLVAPGDRVTKGQVLIKLFDLEPQAKIRAREKELKSIEAKAHYARKNLENADRSRSTGAMPENVYNDIRATALSYEAQVPAAQAELTLAESELKLYNLTAPIDGEIAWLDVSLGTVTWPGSLVWGEIVDLRELDIQCELSPAQVEQVAVGQPAEVWLDGKAAAAGTGKVVHIAKVANRSNGSVPVMVRMLNPQEKVRAEVLVKVRFQTETGK